MLQDTHRILKALSTTKESMWKLRRGNRLRLFQVRDGSTYSGSKTRYVITFKQFDVLSSSMPLFPMRHRETLPQLQPPENLIVYKDIEYEQLLDWLASSAVGYKNAAIIFPHKKVDFEDWAKYIRMPLSTDKVKRG